MSTAVNSTAESKPKENGSKTDIGLLKFLDRSPIDYNDSRKKHDVIKRIPFSSARKRMSTIAYKNKNEAVFLLKGASELVVASCDKIHYKTGEIVPLDE